MTINKVKFLLYKIFLSIAPALINFESSGQTLYGSYYNLADTQEVFCSLDKSSGLIVPIGILSGVQTLGGGESTYDPIGNRWIRVTNLGILLVDPTTAEIQKIIPNPLGVKGIEYDWANSMVFGSYWNGSLETFVSVDLDSGQITNMAVLPGVITLNAGESTYDPLYQSWNYRG